MNNKTRLTIESPGMDSKWGTLSGSISTSSHDIAAGAGNFADNLTVNGVDVGVTLKMLMRRLLILEDNFEKHEQYPALKDAYEKYKVIEQLVNPEIK